MSKSKSIVLKEANASDQVEKLPFYLLCAVVFLVIMGLTALTPMISDDFAYCFSWADWTRIRRVGQIIPSMAEHRIVTNGRVLVHGLVQLLLLLPRPVFCILNALNAVLVCVLTRRLIQLRNRWQELCVLLFGVFCLWCFLPAFGENVLWLDGSLNYFWGLSCSFLFLFPYLADYLDLRGFKNPQDSSHPEQLGASLSHNPSSGLSLRVHHESISVSILRLLLAFVFGTWSENTSLIFLFLAFCLFLLRCGKSRQFRLWPLLWIIAAATGYVFLMTAPATASRAGATSIPVIGYNFRVVFKAAKTYLLLPLLIDAVLFSLAISYRVEKRVIVSSALFIFGALLVHLSYIFAAYFVPRHLCTAVFLLTMASMLLLAGLCRSKHIVFSRIALSCLTALFLLQFPVGVLDIAISFHKQQIREQIIKTALMEGQRSVILENYYPYSAFAVPFELNTIDPSVGPNINVADYYGLDEVLGIDPPEELL